MGVVELLGHLVYWIWLLEETNQQLKEEDLHGDCMGKQSGEPRVRCVLQQRPEKGVFWKRGLFRKVHCLEMVEIVD